MATSNNNGNMPLDMQAQAKAAKEAEATVTNLLKLLQKENDVLSEIARQLKSFGGLRSKETTEIQAQKQALEKIKALEEESQSGAADKLTSLQKEKIILEEKNNFLKEDLDNIRAQIKYRERLEDFAKNGSKIDKERAKIILDNEKSFDKQLKNLKEQYENRKKDYVTSKQKEISLNNSEQAIKTFGSFIGIASNINETWLGQLENTLSSVKSISGAFQGTVKGIQETFNPTKIFESSMTKIAESTLIVGRELDGTLASFNKATGTGGKFNQVIDDTRFGSLQAGVGLKESSEAVQALYENYNNFNQLSSQTQVALSKTTAEFSRLGIASEETGKLLDISTKALRLSGDEALGVEKEITAQALQLGIAPKKMASDFNSAIPKLAQYGRGSIKIFKELETQSKATGISVDSLLGISQKFDTFEGAATAAGKLNAILGGNLLSSVDLLNASEADRITMLRESVSLSGKNYNEMSKFERMSVASAAGIQDMDVAMRLFGTSDEVFAQTKASMDATALSEKELKKAAEAGTSAQEKMKLVMEALSGAALPLLTIFSNMMNAILGLADGYGKYLFTGIIAITGAFYALAKIMSLVSEAKKILAWVTGANVTALAAETEAEEVNEASKIGNIAVTEGQIAAEQGNLVVKEKGIISTIASSIAEKARTAGKWLASAATYIYSAAETASNSIKEKGILLTLRDIAISGVLLVWKGLKTAAEWAWIAVVFVASTAETLYQNIKQQGILLTIKDIAVGLWRITVIAAQAVATGLLSAVTWLATGAIAAFGTAVAIATSPIGLIVLGIVAVIAVLVLLYKHFDEITDFLGKVFSPIISGIGDMFLGLADIVKGVFSSIMDFIKPGINFVIRTVNKVTHFIPGVDVPEIPQLASGTNNFSGGMAIVGENGPELVNIPSGANVINNKNASKLGETMESYSQTKNSTTNNNSQNTTNVKNSNQNSKDDGTRTIILQVDGRELGRTVIDIFEKKMKMNLA